MMTVNERIQDIENRTGLTENIIRRVLNAETESVIESLKRGERATLIGRCTFVPTKKDLLRVGGVLSSCIRVSVKPSPKIEHILRETTDFTNSEGSQQLKQLAEKESELLLAQITDLT